jgi:hypothetical protein
VIAVSVVVIVGAIRAHGDAAFNRWVGWATIDALPFTAIGIVLVLLEKISRVRETDPRKTGAPLNVHAPRGIPVSDHHAQTDLGQPSVTAPVRHQTHAPAPRPSSARIPADPAGRPACLERGITLWGPIASGKTTYLAALNTALAKASPPWTLTGADPANTELLIEMTASLVGRRQFPEATQGIGVCKFVMSGEQETSLIRGFTRRSKRAPIRFDPMPLSHIAV